MKNPLGFLFLLFHLTSLVSSSNSKAMSVSSVLIPKLQTRQPDQLFLRGGTFINLARAREKGKSGGARRKCTLGFAVKRSGQIGSGNFPQAYLITAACVPTFNQHNLNAFIIPEGKGELVVGHVSFFPKAKSNPYNPEIGYDYAFVKADLPFWNPRLSMGVYINTNPPQIAPVIDPITPIVGAPVCFSGAYSGRVCGTVENLDIGMEMLSPWANRLGHHPHEYYQHLVLVRIDNGQRTRAQIDGRHSDDAGAPVYIQFPNPANPTQILGVAPVGILRTYSIGAFEPFGIKLPIAIPVSIPFFCYIPISRIIDNVAGLQLIRSPKQ